MRDTLLRGMRFGPFDILRPLGRGGMAETFLAEHRGPDSFTRNVCLKRILADRAAEEDFVRRFQREARLAARLVHPHIAQVYDFGCEEGTWWMSLEHVPGGDLRGLLRALGQPMPIDLGLVLAVDILEALAYAHDHGIVHRDVSPSNILLDLQGNFKLADFGIAKATHTDRVPGETGFSTTTGTVKGKASYMAPEQALGKKVDGRADLWAFGVVLFEAFARAKPFEGPSDLAVMMAASQGRRAALSEVAPHVPRELCAVIERLLEPDLERRFASAGEVLDALSGHPAPVHGRRRLAELLRAVRPAPAEPAEAAVAVTIESGPPLDLETEAPHLARARDPSAESPRRTVFSVLAALLLAGAVGLVVALASSAPAAPERPSPGSRSFEGPTRGASGPASPAAAPPASASPASASSAAAPPASTPSSPVARGVLVPAELLVPGAAGGPEPDGPVPPPRPRDRLTVSTASARAADRAPSVPAAEPAVAHGTLRVTVIPWGDVSVDGRRVGRSPQVIPLASGLHRVEIASESGSHAREVRIETGRTQELEIDLSGAEPE